MKISVQAEEMRQALQKWLQPVQGMAVVVPDLLKLWEVAYQQTNTPRALICYEGEVVRGAFPEAAVLGRVDRSWLVAIIRGTGFDSVRGNGLTKNVQNAPPFYDQVEEARDVIRCLRNISVELPVDYKGIRPMEKMDDFISGYLIEFTTAVDLPQMSLEEPSANPFWNTEQTATVECEVGEGSATATIAAGQYSSLISQEDADAQALAAATAQAQSELVCLVWTLIDTVTPNINLEELVNFEENGSAILPAGDYKIRYKEGAMRYNLISNWRINFNTINSCFKKVVGGNVTNAPGNTTEYPSQAQCEAANAGAEQEFTLDSSSNIGMYLADSPYDDNIPGNPTPTFELYGMRPI